MTNFKFYTDYPDTSVPDNSENANDNTRATLEILGLWEDTFSESETYAIDDITVHEHKLYECHTAVTTAGVWTGSANWNETSLLVPDE